MIDRKVLGQLIVSHQLLSSSADQVTAIHGSANLLCDLMICLGAAERALAAICMQLNCVPDKKEIALTDYFESLRKTTQPASELQGSDFVTDLQNVRSESQLRFRLPEPRRWAQVRAETLGYVTGWCRQCLGLNLTELAAGPAPLIISSPELDAAVPERGALLKPSKGMIGPVKARYICAGSADIRLPRWGRSEKGRIANLSAGGCNIKSNYAFEVGEEIEMILQVNKMSFRVAGSVVHVPSLDAEGKATAGNPGIGVQFKNMTEGARDRLEELITELKTSKEFRRLLMAN